MGTEVYHAPEIVHALEGRNGGHTGAADVWCARRAFFSKKFLHFFFRGGAGRWA